MDGAPALNAQLTGERYEFAASGQWTAVHAGDVEAMLAEAAQKAQSAPNVLIDMRDVGGFDTFGAWLVERLIDKRPLRYLRLARPQRARAARRCSGRDRRR